MSEAVIDRIHDRIANRRLLDHPFYTAWSRGELSREVLQKYAEQYYHWVRAFPTWLSAVHSNAPDLGMRQEVLENLIDEERGSENHPDLWLRFADALALDRESVRNADLLPETAAALAGMRRVCRAEPAIAGLAALYAYESQQPEVMKIKREGLSEMYGVSTGQDYFVVHETADVAHSAGERALIAAHAVGHEEVVLDAVDEALGATYTILDGIEQYRHRRMTPV